MNVSTSRTSNPYHSAWGLDMRSPAMAIATEAFWEDGWAAMWHLQALYAPCSCLVLSGCGMKTTLPSYIAQ